MGNSVVSNTTYIHYNEIYHVYGEMNFIVQMTETLPESLMSRRPYLTWSRWKIFTCGGPGGVTLLSPNMLLIQVRRALLQSADFSLTERVRAAL